MKTIAIIPARYQSTRLPGKPLAKILGRELILYVVEAAAKAKTVSEVFVATDDARIARVVSDAGYQAIMTREDHPSGTDRIAEAALTLEADLVVNVQGDEAMILPETIDQAVAPLLSDKSLLMSTLKTPIKDPQELFDPDRVKVVTDREDFAIYFSRAPIPFVRDHMDLGGWGGDWPPPEGIVFYKHLGIYVYRKDFLIRYAAMTPGRLEKSEKLEQLRAMEAGFRIKVPTTGNDSLSVDTPKDLARVRKMMEDRTRGAPPALSRQSHYHGNGITK